MREQALRPRNSRYKGLKTLDLSWNSIEGSSRGGLALLEALASDRVQLVSLNLGWNPLRAKGGVMLGEALRRREEQGSLLHLDIAHCLVSEGAACLLAGTCVCVCVRACVCL